MSDAIEHPPGRVAPASATAVDRLKAALSGAYAIEARARGRRGRERFLAEIETTANLQHAGWPTSPRPPGRTRSTLQRLDGIRLVGGPQRISDGGGTQPRWRADGKELYYVSRGRLMAVDTRLDLDRPAGTPRELFRIDGLPVLRDYAVTPDGRRFLAVLLTPAKTMPPAVVLLGWKPPRGP